MKDYTFYIATNPSLTELYGNAGVPVKIGYVSQQNWGVRVRGLNGELDRDATKYGGVKDGENLLTEKWRITKGCFFKVRTEEEPETIEARIGERIIDSGGKKIKGHVTLKETKSVRATELYLLPDKISHRQIRINNRKPSWKEGVSLFGVAQQQESNNYETVEVKTSAEELLQSIVGRLSEEFTKSEDTN